MKHKLKNYLIIGVCVVVLMAAKASTLETLSQISLQSSGIAEGGKIVYGPVEGATTQAQAMANMLKTLHDNYGDRPKVSKLFRFKNTDSVAVFFTVVNHSVNDAQMAGLLIAVTAAPGKIEAAIVTDDATHFKNSVNPMLQQLFDAWHPNGVETDLQVSTEVPSDSTNSTITFGPTPSLNKTRAPDNSAIVGLPEGWGVDIRSGKGSLIVHGSGGEEIGFNLTRTAVDTSNTTEQENLRLGTAANIPNVVYSAFNTNVARNFTSLMQAWRKADNLPPAQMHIDSAEEMKASSGEHCARAKGQMDPDGKGMKAMNIMLCVSESGQPGIYTITKHYSLVPIDKANSDQNAVFAIVSSIKLNQDALEEQAEDAGNAAANRPQNETERIQLLGNQAVTRYNLTQALSDAQHPAYWAQQQNSTTASVHPTSKFSNFLLDLACLEDGSDNTIVNTTAEALAKADPDRFEIVNEPNYWQGVEY